MHPSPSTPSTTPAPPPASGPAVPRRRRRAGITAAALVVGLAFGSIACGGDDNASASGGDFCGSMKSLAGKINGDANLSKDDYVALFDSLGDITPPAALKDEWATFLKSKDFVANPEKATTADVEAVSKAGEKIDGYLKDTCHIKV